MEKANLLIGSYAPDFELPGVDSQVHHLARYLETYRAVGVIFMSNGCPDVQLYLNRLKEIQADFANQGFTSIGINANDAVQSAEDSFEKMRAFAQQHQLNFPYLRDPTQDVARCFRATTTPEVFLLDSEGVVRYGGSIDDNPQAEAVQVSYLRNAIAQLLGGEAVTPNYVTPVGCSLKWRT